MRRGQAPQHPALEGPHLQHLSAECQAVGLQGASGAGLVRELYEAEAVRAAGAASDAAGHDLAKDLEAGAKRLIVDAPVEAAHVDAAGAAEDGGAILSLQGASGAVLRYI